MLNSSKKINKIYIEIKQTGNSKELKKLVELIISSDNVDLALNYLKDFGFNYEIFNYIFNKINHNSNLLQKLIDTIGLDTVIDKVICSNDINMIIKLADNPLITNDLYTIKTLEEAIIGSNNSQNIYRFSKVKNSNKENLGLALVSLKDAIYIRKMAEDFPILAHDLTIGIISTGNIQEIIKFLYNVRGCPVSIILSYLNLDQNGKLILISNLLKEDIVKYHFYADALINGKDLKEQDKKYIQYCQSCDQSLAKILNNDLQLKNHVHVKVKKFTN